MHSSSSFALPFLFRCIPSCQHFHFRQSCPAVGLRSPLSQLELQQQTLRIDQCDKARAATLKALLGNPVDMVRVMSLISVGGTTVFGPAGASLTKLLGSSASIGLLFSGMLLLWIVLPLGAAILLFRRQSLV